MSESTEKAISKYLSFKLGGESFALDVSQVREILDMIAITKVPRSPDFMRGIINVRGNVVPVVDLSMKFGMSKAEQTADSRIVVMEIDLYGELTTIGALADAVHDVMEMDFSQIEPPPKIGSKMYAEFITGIGKHNDQFIIILDVDRIFPKEELMLFKAGDSTPPP